MPKFELIHRNSMGCEVGRYEVPNDDHGYPLILSALQSDYDLRSGLEVLEPGDTLTFVDNEA